MDIRHFYREAGQGETLLLLHGNGEDSAYFASQTEAFSKYFHVYAIDTRGHGQTKRGDAPFTLSQFADDLHGFMEEHRIEKAHILGFSDGGNIAMLFSVRYPEKVGKLILNGANYHPSGIKRFWQFPIEMDYKMAMKYAGTKEDAKKKAELLSLMVNEPNLTKADLQKIKAETLVIVGSRDMVKASHTKALASMIKNAKLVTVKGDHFVAAKHPDAFNKAVLSFLL